MFLISSLVLTIIIIVSVLVLIGVILLIVKLTKKEKGQKVDSLFMEEVITSLGGIDNILNYSVENARVKFELNNISLIDQTKIMKLSPKGAFITGNNVKTLFKYESKEIVKNLDKLKK